jgi:ribosomal protein S6
MKRYEGLFILNTAGKEETLKDTIDKISSEITSAGGKVETVQKMDKKSFSRVADKKFSAGFYVNVVFESTPATVNQLRQRFVNNDEVFRVLFTQAPVATEAPAAIPAAK